ncbi:hypothetical protein [Dyella sp. 2RAB6]|uniref:hypothetical protein n=1 Tax=Dyella sp. 2RAB6 TaxID=3232992 RepID=UPI003F8DD515
MRWQLLMGGVALAAALQIARAAQPAPEVVVVQPSGAEVPANLLRLSVVFAAPIEGEVLPRIALSRADGRPLQEPFLPQELWSPDGKILTLLLHPGRVKTGLVAREQQGPIVSEGDDVVLTFDGHPIKRWHVGAVDGNGPVASAWKLSRVHAGSREPFVVTLDNPIDGLDVDYLAVVDGSDHLIAGQRQLRDGETTWTFTPAAAWKAGDYRLMVRGTLEDASGNRLGGHFETSIDSPQPPAADVGLDFKVSPDRRQGTSAVNSR